MPKAVTIIQCREGSQRFPHKCWALLHGKPIIKWVVERAKGSCLVDQVVIASPQPLSKDPGVPVLVWKNGDESDVLGRYVWAATQMEADLVVRITGDCPLLYPNDIDRCLGFMECDERIDYASNVIGRVGSEGYGDGFEVEVIRYSALRRIDAAAKSPEDREHVTRYLKEHPWEFTILGVKGAFPTGKWSVDTEGDLSRISKATDGKCRITSTT